MAVARTLLGALLLLAGVLDALRWHLGFSAGPGAIADLISVSVRKDANKSPDTGNEGRPLLLSVDFHQPDKYSALSDEFFDLTFGSQLVVHREVEFCQWIESPLGSGRFSKGWSNTSHPSSPGHVNPKTTSLASYSRVAKNYLVGAYACRGSDLLPEASTILPYSVGQGGQIQVSSEMAQSGFYFFSENHYYSLYSERHANTPTLKLLKEGDDRLQSLLNDCTPGDVRASFETASLPSRFALLGRQRGAWLEPVLLANGTERLLVLDSRFASSPARDLLAEQFFANGPWRLSLEWILLFSGAFLGLPGALSSELHPVVDSICLSLLMLWSLNALLSALMDRQTPSQSVLLLGFLLLALPLALSKMTELIRRLRRLEAVKKD